ncbi:tripartite tricarboxylate transporter substrate binding protein [Diaphorobacter sp.]|uniref:Bug family tripartite tricarboxylate transporter substrate binding protein n=1 Tax=Diaphorobacter sp. TaxID=1934310 RepID=UPI0028ABDBDE|nr:tripartite tricarboxylate transporter substrate binding protein [Diaphorobacter sp.]
MTHPTRLKAIAAASLLAFCMSAHAEKYPSRAVNIIVPFSPGGVTDVMARLVANKLQDDLGATVVVVNKPGAGTTIATNYVSKSAPDGYNILMAASSFTIGPSLYKEKAGYDPEKNFKPVSLLATVPHLLVVNPQLPVTDVTSLVKNMQSGDQVRANFGSSGPGTSNHLEGELFASMAGLNLNHIPFKGSVPALTAIAGNDVSFMFVDIAAAKPFLDSNKVKPIAITTSKRSALWPQLPTVEESGLKNFHATPWLGFVVPAGTPDSVIATLNKSLAKMRNDPQVGERFAAMGIEPVFNSATEFHQFMRSDRVKWEDVISRAKISAAD